MNTNTAPPSHLGETCVGLGIVATGLGLGLGARSISSEAGYGGVGPNFLPMLVAALLVLCGVLITWQARTGGFRDRSDADTDDAKATSPPFWLGFVWVSAGLLLNAGLIERVGFALGCALCYVLSVRGLRLSQGQLGAMAPRTWLIDAITGLAIALPVYWFFTQFLDIALPGLTESGWL